MIVNHDTENNDKYHRLLFNKERIVFFYYKVLYLFIGNLLSKSN